MFSFLPTFFTLILCSVLMKLYLISMCLVCLRWTWYLVKQITLRLFTEDDSLLLWKSKVTYHTFQPNISLCCFCQCNILPFSSWKGHCMLGTSFPTNQRPSQSDHVTTWVLWCCMIFTEVPKSMCIVTHHTWVINILLKCQHLQRRESWFGLSIAQVTSSQTKYFIA